MGEGTRVEDDAVSCIVQRLVEGVDQCPFVVALKECEIDLRERMVECVLKVLEGCCSIGFGLSGA